MAGHTPQNHVFSFLSTIVAALLCTTFGANAVAVKVSFAGLGVFTTAGLRFSIASLAILLWALVTRRSLKIKEGQAFQLLVISILFTVQLGVLYLGLSKTSASRGILLINLQPFFILFLAHYFIPGDRMTRRKVLGIILGFAGVVFVFFDKKGVATDFRTGDLMLLTNAFLWAASTVYVKRIIDDFSPFHIVLYPAIFSVPFFFLGGFFWDGTMISRVDARVLIALLYQGLVTASFGFIAWNHMLQKHGAVSLHSFVFIMPLAGVLLAGVLLGEPMTLNILTALFLVVSGIIVVHANLPKKFAIVSS
jgi:drug/metabolite transporter (DMT)-like permease